jgi:hypothetical protein
MRERGCVGHAHISRRPRFQLDRQAAYGGSGFNKKGGPIGPPSEVRGVARA